MREGLKLKILIKRLSNFHFAPQKCRPSSRLPRMSQEATTAVLPLPLLLCGIVSF